MNGLFFEIPERNQSLVHLEEKQLNIPQKMNNA
jgi:hypothetical protein